MQSNKSFNSALRARHSRFKALVAGLRTLEGRILVDLIVVGCALVVIVIKLFTISVTDASALQAEALNQWTRNTAIAAQRGNIISADNVVLAQSVTAYRLLVWPNVIPEADRERIAVSLSDIKELDRTYKYIYERVCDTSKNEIVIARQIDSEVADKITAMKLGKGVVITTDVKRYYPRSDLLTQVMGYTNKIDGFGQSGLELQYEKYLAGTNGRVVSERDRKGNSVGYGTQDYINPIDGCNVVLTVDSNIQSYLEDALKEALEVNSAKTAQGVIIDAKTGAILALSTQPSYDLNNIPRDDMAALSALSRNRVVADVYEPGSTFKIITLASGLDSGAVDDNYTCTCGGSKVVNGETIKCWKSAGHGTQNLTQCAENSCNCAFMDIALRMGTDEFYKRIYSFGFGSSTGSGLSSETSGIVTSQKYIRDTDLARIGFGQSIAVTPLQLVTAVAAAVNGGNLMQPYIVNRIVSSDGETVMTTEPTVVRSGVVSQSTSKKVCTILESVVEKGSGKNAKVSGYRIGGKTGTSQKYDNGVVSSGKLVASFIGIAPMDDPQYICLILVDEPQVGVVFGSTVAAPFVKTVMEKTLVYCNVPKTEEACQTVTVPDIANLNTAEAASRLSALGLNAKYQSSGKVLIQVPAAGSTAIIGTDVLLYTDTTTVDVAQTTVTMIDVSGLTHLQAYQKLKAIGIEMKIVGKYEGGKVISQSIPEGTKVDIGSTVELTFKYN